MRNTMRHASINSSFLNPRTCFSVRTYVPIFLIWKIYTGKRGEIVFTGISWAASSSLWTGLQVISSYPPTLSPAANTPARKTIDWGFVIFLLFLFLNYDKRRIERRDVKPFETTRDVHNRRRDEKFYNCSFVRNIRQACVYLSVNDYRLWVRSLCVWRRSDRPKTLTKSNAGILDVSL